MVFLEAIHHIASISADSQVPAIEVCRYDNIYVSVFCLLGSERNHGLIRQGHQPICALSGFT